MTTVKEAVRRPLGHFAERSLVGLLAVTGAGVGFGLLLMLVRFHWSPLYHADLEAAGWFNRQVSPHHAVVSVLQVITDLGGRLVLTMLVAIGVIGLLIRRQPRLAVYLVVTGVGGTILTASLKALVGRLRPVVDVPVAHAPGNSFPSGHSLGSFVAYGALLLVFLPAMAPRWRKPAIALVGMLVGLIGLTRVALGVHFVSDVLGGWLLGAAWLGVSAAAFQLWRRERGRPAPPLTEGLEPEAAPAITPAPDEEHVLPHPRSSVAELLVGWVFVFGALYGFGVYVSFHAGGTVFGWLDRVLPRWFAAHHTPTLTEVSWWWGKVGDTYAILTVAIVFCPLVVAVWRRWRPVLFVALVMLGEVALFLAAARAVDRSRPPVHNLDGHMPTSSFPSGHVAATICLYGAIAILVMARTDRWWRWLAVVLAVILPAMVATSRMYRGMHHPTDVMGAILLSALWITLLYVVLRPNEDVKTGSRPAIESEDVDQFGDELVRAGRAE